MGKVLGAQLNCMLRSPKDVPSLLAHAMRARYDQCSREANSRSLEGTKPQPVKKRQTTLGIATSEVDWSKLTRPGALSGESPSTQRVTDSSSIPTMKRRPKTP